MSKFVKSEKDVKLAQMFGVVVLDLSVKGALRWDDWPTIFVLHPIVDERYDHREPSAKAHIHQISK